MTAVMRAMQTASGPKVLRIGLLQSGRILEERIVKQRTSVTVGPSEKSTFVVQANLPPQFKLFELIGSDYHLNFLDGMTGRVALATGITDLTALKGQAKRVGPAYQIRLTEEARGKIVLGETTFLFQFVAPPPVTPRPQLPLSVKGGLASQIDWNLTIIAAFSFLLHFGLIGAMYSDWLDPVVNDGVSATLMHLVKEPDIPPPPAPTSEEKKDTKDTKDTKESDKKDTGKTNPNPKPSPAPAPNQNVVNGLLNDIKAFNALAIGAMVHGPNTQRVAGPDSPPVDIGSIFGTNIGTNNSPTGLNDGASTGPVGLNDKGTDFANIGAGTKTAADVGEKAHEAKKVQVDVTPGPVVTNAKVADLESVIRRDLFPQAKRCYQRDLANSPDQAGKIVIQLDIDSSGDVKGASVTNNTGLTPKVANCILGAARGLQFAAGGGGRASVPFTFVHQ
jgi:hypothetical protein